MARFPPASLSMHAEQRLSERFKITKESLLGLLNSGLGVRIGASKETHLIHRLLWSDTDNAPLVAIQDVVDGTLLTLLTADMYQRDYDSRLTEKRLQRSVDQLAHHRRNQRSGQEGTSTPGKALIVGYFSDDQVRILGTWKEEVPSGNLEALGTAPHFWGWVIQRIHDKELPLERLRSVGAKSAKWDGLVLLRYAPNA